MATESFTLQNIPVTFTCDIEFYVLPIIAQNVVIFIITMYQQQEPILDEFLIPYLKIRNHLCGVIIMTKEL